jgi:type IV pilus assembly protein PilN
MIRINLLPVRKKIQEQNIRYQITVGVLMIIFFIFVMAYFYSTLSRSLNKKQAELTELKKENEKLDKEVGYINKIRKEKKTLKAKLDVIASLGEGRLLIVKVLDEISQAKPEKLWLTSLEQSRGTIEAGGGFQLKIKGMALGNEIIAQFMINLQKFPYFKEVDLVSTKQVGEKQTGIKLKQFDLISKILFPAKKGATKKGKK